MGYIKQTDLVTRWKNRRLSFFNFRQGQFLVHSVPSFFVVKITLLQKLQIINGTYLCKKVLRNSTLLRSKFLAGRVSDHFKYK